MAAGNIRRQIAQMMQENVQRPICHYKKEEGDDKAGQGTIP